MCFERIQLALKAGVHAGSDSVTVQLMPRGCASRRMRYRCCEGACGQKLASRESSARIGKIYAGSDPPNKCSARLNPVRKQLRAIPRLAPHSLCCRCARRAVAQCDCTKSSVADIARVCKSRHCVLRIFAAHLVRKLCRDPIGSISSWPIQRMCRRDPSASISRCCGAQRAEPRSTR